MSDVEDYVARMGLDQLFADEAHAPAAASLGINHTVDPDVTEPYAPEWPDLVRLHRAVRERKVTTVLEFGCGFSTSVMAHALLMNREEHADFVSAHLRRNNPFELHVVDDMPEWVATTRDRLRPDLAELVTFHVAEVEMTTFADRIATRYTSLPNICPDLVYLDGPSQASATGDVSGISTRHPDRLPMACDLLRLEHFLLPGTLVLVDGRTANARFLAANFQRRWAHTHDVEADVHHLEMVEPPLGPLNRRAIEFCLGPQWLDALDP